MADQFFEKMCWVDRKSIACLFHYYNFSSSLSSSLVIIPEQQYKHSDIEGQKSHDCLLEQALLYSMHLALYPKVEQHCQTNSGMKKNVWYTGGDTLGQCILIWFEKFPSFTQNTFFNPHKRCIASSTTIQSINATPLEIPKGPTGILE